MTREEWTRSLVLRLATGHSNWPLIQEARDWLAGKAPPEKWEPKAKEEFEKRKVQGG